MMRKLVLVTGLVFAFLFAATAQSKPRASITLNIPFEFSLGNRVLPAGTYKLDSVLGAPIETDHLSILALRSVEGHLYQAVVTDVAGGEAMRESTLVFAYFHGQRYLSQVWLAGQAVGLSVHLPQKSGLFRRDREESELVELAPLPNR